MTSFKKMSLIANEELERLKQKQLSSYNPELRSMVFLKDEMDQLLLRTDLPVEEKLKLFQTAQHLFDSLKPQVQLTPAASTPSVVRTEDQEEERADDVEPERPLMGPSAQPASAFARAVTKLPKTMQSKGNQLVEFLDEHEGIITATPKGELAIRGESIPGTNFSDLFRHLFIHRKQTPPGLEHFVSALRELNVPRSTLSNRKVIDLLDPEEFHDASNLSTSETQTGKGIPPGKRPRILYLYKH